MRNFYFQLFKLLIAFSCIFTNFCMSVNAQANNENINLDSNRRTEKYVSLTESDSIDILQRQIEDLNEDNGKLKKYLEECKYYLGRITSYKDKIDATEYKSIQLLIENADKQIGKNKSQFLQSIEFLPPFYEYSRSIMDFSDSELSSIKTRFDNQLNLVYKEYSNSLRQADLNYSDDPFSEDATKLTSQDVETIKKVFNEANFNTYKSKLKLATENTKNEIDKLIKQHEQDLNVNKDRISQSRSKLDEKREEGINLRAITFGLPLFCFTVLLLYAIPFLGPMLLKGKNSESFANVSEDIVFSSGLLTEITTILLLTMTILILGLAGKMPGEVLGTLIGGISGYVLNRIRERATKQENNTPQQEPKPQKEFHQKRKRFF